MCNRKSTRSRSRSFNSQCSSQLQLPQYLGHHRPSRVRPNDRISNHRNFLHQECSKHQHFHRHRHNITSAHFNHHHRHVLHVDRLSKQASIIDRISYAFQVVSTRFRPQINRLMDSSAIFFRKSPRHTFKQNRFHIVLQFILDILSWTSLYEYKCVACMQSKWNIVENLSFRYVVNE